jgi:hypothetical protein
MSRCCRDLAMSNRAPRDVGGYLYCRGSPDLSCESHFCSRGTLSLNRKSSEKLCETYLDGGPWGRGFHAGLAFFNLGLALSSLILGRRCGLMEVPGCRHLLYLSSRGVSFYGCVLVRLNFGSSFLLSSASWLGVGFLFHGSGSFFSQCFVQD